MRASKYPVLEQYYCNPANSEHDATAVTIQTCVWGVLVSNLCQGTCVLDPMVLVAFLSITK
jgi:hypothetical protein